MFSVITLMNDWDRTWVAKMSGWRKKVLISLSKAQLTNTISRTSLKISSMLPSTLKCSPSLCLQQEVSWQTKHFCSGQSFVQLCSSCVSWEVSRLCGVANRLLQLSAAKALFISLSLLCMVWSLTSKI